MSNAPATRRWETQGTAGSSASNDAADSPQTIKAFIAGLYYKRTINDILLYVTIMVK